MPVGGLGCNESFERGMNAYASGKVGGGEIGFCSWVLLTDIKTILEALFFLTLPPGNRLRTWVPQEFWLLFESSSLYFSCILLVTSWLATDDYWINMSSAISNWTKLNSHDHANNFCLKENIINFRFIIQLLFGPSILQENLRSQSHRFFMWLSML